MSSLLLETIRIEDGQAINIEWHNKRFYKTQKKLFNINSKLNLETLITPPSQQGLYRCRILYNENIKEVQYFPYQAKKIKKLKIVSSQLDYSFKYVNRDKLNKLLLPTYDDIIIEKNGFLTDTSIANIAFYHNNQWFTPKTPLLQGTMREKLLFEGFLTIKNIRKEVIHQFSHFALMNAMIGFQIQKNIIIE